MKKMIVLSALVLGLFQSSQAQELRVTTQAGYIFDDRFDSYYDPNGYYSGIIKGAFQWGAGVEYMATDDYGIEVSYQRQKTTVPMKFYSFGDKSATFNTGINWIMVGGNRYFNLRNKMVDPYFGGQVGVVIFDWKNPSNGNSGNVTKFAWNIRTGTRLWLSKSVGLNLQAQLSSAVQSIGGGLYFGTGGTGAGINTNSSIFQFGLGGGLIFRFRSKG